MITLSVPSFPRLAAATVFSLLLAPAAMAQDAAVPAPAESESLVQPVAESGGDTTPAADAAGSQDGAGTYANNPHEMLDELSGGPLGSPTATRGNPLPGTSTAIPTTNPATVFPLSNPTGAGVWIEDTGIDGQCDPSQSFGKCPERPAKEPAAATDMAVAPADASGEMSSPDDEITAPAIAD